LAITQALAGLAGFFATLVASLLVDKIQSNGNEIFGISIYAQQFMSLIAFLLTLVVIIYVSIALIRKRARLYKSES
jgi:uncharacterized BrkB/YihY/UPF0761 family membrane protein